MNVEDHGLKRLRRLKEQRLLLITEDPHILVDSNLYSVNVVNAFFVRLGDYFKALRISCPLKKSTQIDKYIAQKIPLDKNIQMTERPFYYHKNEILFRPFDLIKTLLLVGRDVIWADVILYRLPSPLIIPLWGLFFLLRKKVILYIAGDFYGRNTSRSGGMKGFLNNRVVKLYDFAERHMTKRFYTLAAGMELAQKFECDIFFTNLIQRDDIQHTPKKFDAAHIKLLYVGRLDKKKGIDYLVQAMQFICKQWPEGIELILVGDGPYKNQLELLVKKLSLQHHIQFVGSVPFGDALWKWFKQADIFILPSLSEGIPKVLLEAMTFALPIIATKVGGIPWITQNGKAAMLIEPGSPETIQHAILQLIHNERLRKEFVQEGLTIARMYTVEERLICLANILYQHGM